MKKIAALISILLSVFAFTACGASSARKIQTGKDVDLTVVNPLIAYSEMCEVFRNPDPYVGAKFKVRGRFVSYYVNSTKRYHASLTVEDAPNCCAVGIEFLLKGEPPCPEGYPARDAVVTISGTFSTYEDGGTTYCRLIDAEIL